MDPLALLSLLARLEQTIVRLEAENKELHDALQPTSGVPSPEPNPSGVEAE